MVQQDQHHTVWMRFAVMHLDVLGERESYDVTVLFSLTLYTIQEVSSNTKHRKGGNHVFQVMAKQTRGALIWMSPR